jgi:hypothetical protein
MFNEIMFGEMMTVCVWAKPLFIHKYFITRKRSMIDYRKALFYRWLKSQLKQHSQPVS